MRILRNQGGLFQKPLLNKTPRLAPKPEPRGARGPLRTTAERRIDEACHVIRDEVRFIDSRRFRVRNAEALIYERAPQIPRAKTDWYMPVLDTEIGSNIKRAENQQVILTGAEEKVLFHQMNYALYRLEKIRRALRGIKPDTTQASEILKWRRIADSARDQIAGINLGLVLFMSKRSRIRPGDFADMVSEGNMALLRAVDRFDCERGYKFSTYACRAISKAFSRLALKKQRLASHEGVSYNDTIGRTAKVEDLRHASAVQDLLSDLSESVRDNSAELSEVEHTIIMLRFGMDDHDPEATPSPMTLVQVGQIVGVTKERVRQIQNKALEKLRADLDARLKPQSRKLLDAVLAAD